MDKIYALANLIANMANEDYEASQYTNRKEWEQMEGESDFMDRLLRYPMHFVRSAFGSPKEESWWRDMDSNWDFYDSPEQDYWKYREGLAKEYARKAQDFRAMANPYRYGSNNDKYEKLIGLANDAEAMRSLAAFDYLRDENGVIDSTLYPWNRK